ncbi:MAG: FMN-binding negative transcriptional regulator [Chitinophagaceae bacterium]|nr:FMN-binding negative transcriptional regulator [Chitinophagaceae bacterium]
MYKLPYFSEEDNDKVVDHMRRNPFAIICGMDTTYPVATQVPLDLKIVNDKIILTGHMMKNTDHHKAFLKNENVLVIFTGPHCYVSASWYIKQDIASTWNYISVHAKGKITFGDEAATRKIVENLTNQYEQPESAAAFDKLPVEYIDRLVKAIVGFTIEVESKDNVFKLSQNHEPATRESIIKHLNKNGSDNEKEIASEMQQRIGMPKM